MKLKHAIPGLLLCVMVSATGQITPTDSLLNLINTSQDHSIRISAYVDLSFQLRNNFPDSAFQYAQDALALAQKIESQKGEAMALHQLGNINYKKGEFDEAVDQYQKALLIHRAIGDSLGVADNFQGLGNAYRRKGNYSTALRYHLECKLLREKFGGDDKSLAYAYLNIGNIYFSTQEFDKAIAHYQEVVKLYKGLNNWHDIAIVYNNIFATLYQQGKYEASINYLEKSFTINDSLGNTIQKAVNLSNLGEVHAELKNFDKAQTFATQALGLFVSIRDSTFIQNTLINLGNICFQIGNYQKAIDHYQEALGIAKAKGDIANISNIYERLADNYQALEDFKAAFQAKENYLIFKDSLSSLASEKELNELKTRFETEQIEAENALLRLDQATRKSVNRWLLAGLCLATLLSLLAWWALHQRRTAYRHLQAQKENTEKLLEEKEQLLSELKQAQVQLLQSEKMASIGQLTAGIAHELNNPIGFVSANSVALKQDVEEFQELLNQLKIFKASPTKTNRQKLFDLYDSLDIEYLDQEILELVDSIIRGATRTKDIVTSLRIFSRNTTEEFDPADINEGLDSTLTILNSQFMDRIQVHRDYNDLPLVRCQITKINQVFLNIINNAVQAIEGKGHIYIQTRTTDHKTVQITIRDTGKGIPPAIQKRIFEPFFTTKEVGKGTGLGLSISYSIIEQHSGKIEVESMEGEGATFLVELPLE